MLTYNKRLKSTAQDLRRNMTPEEKHLWYDFLRRLPCTVKRKQTIDDYVVDFYVAKYKTVIEVVDAFNFDPEYKKVVLQRDRLFSEMGITVLKYARSSINEHFFEVTKGILKRFEVDPSELKPKV